MTRIGQVGKLIPRKERSLDRLKLDERRNFALSRFGLPTGPTAKVPAKETSAGPTPFGKLIPRERRWRILLDYGQTIV